MTAHDRGRSQLPTEYTDIGMRHRSQKMKCPELLPLRYFVVINGYSNMLLAK
ncbi:MAG: hypothetical protein KME27_05445 [Lyngbya sp. HA4199-MV5]|nr:hypothetical protein [Lyngbya sp. HA4199-MV5]